MSYSPNTWPAADPEPISPSSLRWEETRCLLCNCQHAHTLLDAPDYQGGTGLIFAVVQCDECGLCYTNPRPVGPCLTRFYPNDYRPHHVAGNQPVGRLRQWSKRWRKDEPPLPWHGQGRLLDFGCGGGAFLAKMRSHGWQVTGIDTSATTVLRLRTETGLNVVVGSLPHAELEPSSFDVVTMWHALEHVPDPRTVLREARQLLDCRGKLLVAVPNIDSLAFRIFGRDWFGLDLPRHLTHFTPWTLHLMLERTGFQVESIRMIRHSAWLRHSARLACRSESPSLFHRGLTSKWLSRLVAFFSHITQQTDCIIATAHVAENL
jgi:SAM-dependent methyltransferase